MAMDLALATVLVAVYGIVDDLSQSESEPRMPACGGPPAQLSDAEGLCSGLAVQWRSGVPWKSARGSRRDEGDYDLRDGCPLPVAPGARSFPPGWLADSARMGKGGHDRYCSGVRLMRVLDQNG